ncbi:MAG TPA: hypothetical protein VHD56_15995 [Tepidisphaeraceae bacterium]|nr:hypothetical protein [Tepidisphaeraceae bacterium]
MTYSGKVTNGVIVLEGSLQLPEGTVVAVETIGPGNNQAKRGTAEAILNSSAHWHGDPNEIDQFLAELQNEKQAEVESELQSWTTFPRIQ